MKYYFSLGKGEYVDIDWGGGLKEKRGISHIRCDAKKGSCKVGEIVYRAASFCLGPKELAEHEKGAIGIRIQNSSSHLSNGKCCYTVIFYNAFSALFEVAKTKVKVFHHPDADVEILVDDAFQMALSEVVRGRGGWVFHGSGVAYKDQALLFVGASHSGKTTTCLSLLQGGFSLLGDDASLVIPKNKRFWAVPLARELSVRPQALTLLQSPHQIALHPVGERFFWRRANFPQDSVLLKVISSLEMAGGKETYLEKLTPQEFYNLYRRNPPFHGFSGNVFKQCVKVLSRGGIRFVKGRLGVSPEATRQAYIECFENPGQDRWRGWGKPKVMVLHEGRKLVGKYWAKPRISALSEVIPLLAHPITGLAVSAQTILATEPLSNLEPLPWKNYDELWASDKKSHKKINWCRIGELKNGTQKLLKDADWRFVGKNVERWLQMAPVLYPFLRHYSQDNPQLRLLIDAGWRRYLAQKYPSQLMFYLTEHCRIRYPYDYTIEKMRQGDRNLVWKRLEQLLDWAQEHNFSSIGLKGDEPTPYSWFPDLVKTITTKGVPFYFDTNLLFSFSLRSWIKKAAGLEIHLCDCENYSLPQVRILKQNLSWLQRQNFPRVFHYNLWRRKLKDWEWITDIVREFGDGNLTFAFPFLSSIRRDLFLMEQRLEKFAKIVVEFVRHCEKRGLKAIAAEPYPLCAFSGKEALHLLKHGVLRGTCEISPRNCTENLMVNTEHREFPYITLDFSPGSIAVFPSRGELEIGLRKTAVKSLEKVNYEQCRRCELRSWKLCVAGSLSYCTPEKTVDILVKGKKVSGKHTSH